MPLICSTRTAQAGELLSVRGLEHWKLRRFPTGAALRAAWPETFRPDDFWVSKEVLSFLTDNPQGLETEAVLLEDSRNFRRVLLTTQTFSFSAAGQVKDGVKGQTSGWDLRRRMLAPFSFRVLSIGQFLTSGNFSTDGLAQLPTSEASKLLPAVAETLMRLRPGYAAAVFKDLYPSDHPVVETLQTNGHFLMPSDPVMRIDIAADWQTFEDYLAALTSKYRVRYRRARSKLEGITSRPLSAAEVNRNSDRFQELYYAVSGDADFNAASLRPNYFSWLASLKSCKSSFQTVKSSVGSSSNCAEVETATCFTGYFDQSNELIGFTSAVPNGDVLHAHFLGLVDEYKYSHHLYHNMLFDLLEQAIGGGFRALDYGRTALEIKSSVGARATNFAVLAKARYNWLNRLIPLFTPAVYAAPKWVERNPFRGR
ncbi:hypothetical protein FUA23_19175 [Neolewinella aurantiaca]|uniref:BioF2-like acetyltransferase domain-containing protein n=2 Tax=Neolewinella aurantiaca TaxID=2602767 RepID=A0A5C7FK93_9BACT|nr:hypothetical protein FUA23_19175 [Neolewinella aurantiaca]